MNKEKRRIWQREKRKRFEYLKNIGYFEKWQEQEAKKKYQIIHKKPLWLRLWNATRFILLNITVRGKIRRLENGHNKQKVGLIKQ